MARNTFVCGFLSLVHFLISASAEVTCPPLTPDLPLLEPLGNVSAISAATSNLTRSIESTLATGVVLDNKTTSFIVDFYSLLDNTSLYSYSFNAPAFANASEGVKKVEADTVFRLGSISKVLTVYTFLKNAGDLSWNDPITKYIPELASEAQSTAQESEIMAVRWDNVTVGSLAAQLSGTPRASTDDAAADHYYQRAAGLPAVPAVNTSFCPPNSTNAQPCNRQAFFQNEFLQYPIVAPYYQPVYSNNAYQILAYALEAMTNSSFEALVNETFSSLGMTGSSYLAPASSQNSIIPFNDSTAEYSQDVYTLGPGGGMYSTLTDMRTFGLAVLSSAQLPPTLTRQWLKPLSFTPDRYISVGAPWQIHPYPANARYATQVYAKGGNLGLYASEIGLIPDYNVGFTVLAAGLKATVDNLVLSDLILQSFMPAIQNITAQQSQSRYAGTYTAANSNSSISMSIQPNDRGTANLVVDTLIADGHDFLRVIAKLEQTTRSQLLAELYYTGLSSDNGSTTIESWRLRPGAKANSPEMAAALAGLGSITNTCNGWEGLDPLTYGGIGLDEVLITVDKATQKATGVDVRVLQAGVWRASMNGRRAERMERRV